MGYYKGIIITKENLIEAMNFIPEGTKFFIHNAGEYGEYIISLEDEAMESSNWFDDFLKQCTDNASDLPEWD